MSFNSMLVEISYEHPMLFCHGTEHCTTTFIIMLLFMYHIIIRPSYHWVVNCIVAYDSVQILEHHCTV